jgi:hypothetical protein
MAWFWRVFILIFSQWRSSMWVFGLQVMITGWSSKVRLGFDTSMLNVSWLVRRLASAGGVKTVSSKLEGLHFKTRPMLMLSLSSRNPSQPKRGYLLLPWRCREVLTELETHNPKFVESDLGYVLREELQSSITKVSVRILLWTLPVILEMMQMDERETHFREVFVFGVLQARGVCKAERPSQSWAQGTTHIQETHMTTANTIKNTQGNQQTIAEITRGTSSTNDA